MAEDRPRSVKDVSADAFIRAFAAYLKQTNKVQLPQYVDYVKTGAFKELSPLDPDWYYTRAAAIARRVYINQGMGVGAFRRVFGGRSNKAGSVTPEHHAKAAGGIIRHALQQLEAMGLVEKNPATRGGRRITPEGQRQMDLVAGSLPLARFHYLG
jgi:small subunit ribosomal protein S19e